MCIGASSSLGDLARILEFTGGCHLLKATFLTRVSKLLSHEKPKENVIPDGESFIILFLFVIK